MLSGTSRSGSNSFAIAPGRTSTGSAILASDPHLGISLPNTWLIIGLNSPSYQVVGLMVPGLPIFALGRNPWIAWGGTNMRATASDLIDVSGLPPGSISERTETISVRWRKDKPITIRETDWGPILSDAPQLRGLGSSPIALRWTGHSVSDEVSAFLKVAAATNFEQFRSSFSTFAVPGQNMLYADGAGNIGKIFAVQVPDRRGSPPADVVISPAEATRTWADTFDVLSFPAIYNPSKGFVASANDRPPDTVPVGHFFSPDDRIKRMASLIEGGGCLELETVKSFQRDVYVGSAVALRDIIVGKIKQAVNSEATAKEHRLIDLVAAWDGHYRAESAGAVAFELLRHAVTSDLYRALLGKSAWAAFANIGRINELMIEDIQEVPLHALAPLLKVGIRRAAERLDQFPSWGDMHRLVLAHPLAALPVAGRRFRVAEYPIGGSSDALIKTAHGLTAERHRASYGSNARHVSDLADPDGNYFVLLGGQDGRLNSSTFADQVPLWLSGAYVRMPLRLETVAAEFPATTTLTT